METEKIQKRIAKPIFMPSDVDSFTESLFGDDLHAKRVRSISDTVIGILHVGSLGVHAIGRGLAIARGLIDKHAIKQVDRFLSNSKIIVWILFGSWVPYIVGSAKKIVVNLDWTEFDRDDQTMLVASIQTSHGRSIPLMWKTVRKSELKGRTNEYEFELLRRFKECLPADVNATIVADRGFADPELFNMLKNELGFDYIIRFKALIHVTNNAGVTKPANDWIGENGRMRVLRDVKLTCKKYPVATVVIVCAKEMKEIWCIAASDPNCNGRIIIRYYGRRFTIEEMFRDVKDLRFGMGMSWNSISDPARRDRMFLVVALAQSLLTILGQAGEDVGLDKLLKSNTTKKRSLSLMRQGLMWYERIPNMNEDRLILLLTRFSDLITQDTFFGSIINEK